MVARNFNESLRLVLLHEGGYVNLKADPGGPTNKGVTLATFRRYVNPKGTIADLKNISKDQIAKVYHDHYWDAVRADDLPDGVDYAVFDFAVNSGPGRAAEYLQAVVGATVDGDIGPKTLKAVRALPADQVIKNLCGDRMEFLQGLKTWKTFGKGWKSRVDGVRAEALKMAKSGVGNAEVTTPNPSIPKASEPKTPDLGTTPPSPPAATPVAPTGWLSLILSLFKKSAPGGSGQSQG